MASEWIPEAGAVYAPVTPSRRRRRLSVGRIFAGLAALAVLGSAGVVLWYALDPPPLPESTIEDARAAVREASTRAIVLAKPEVEEARLQILILERLVAEERAKLVRFSTNPRIAEIALDTERQARAAIAKADEITLRTVRDSASQRLQLEARLAEIEPQVRNLKGDRTIQRAYSKAEHSVEELHQVEKLNNLPMIGARLRDASEDVAAAEQALSLRLERFSDPTLRRRWQAWVDETVRAGGTVILVEKKRQKLLVVRDRRVIATFHAEFGRNGYSDKIVQGDAATPEGRYQVTSKKTSSRYYKALPLNYPTAADVAEYTAARKRGLVRGRGPGTNIEIHGGGGKGTNWTDGCVAVSDRDIDRLFELVGSGTPVTIVGAARLPGD